VSLETVDLPGVEILAADVRIHGRGSPSAGDLYSVEDLRAIADANRELAAELRPPAKIGHDGYGPAVGQLENIRVSGKKLLADVRRVPKKFAELVNSGAYGARSVELSRVTSQRTGRRYDFVVTALAWLGDRMPAVRTLDDVHALYDGRGELVRAYQLDVRSENGAALVAEAIELGVITEGAREATLRLYASAPDATRELLDSMGLAEIRALEAWFKGEQPGDVWPEEDERLYREYRQALGDRAEEII
jgi:hypothetical protein